MILDRNKQTTPLGAGEVFSRLQELVQLIQGTLQCEAVILCFDDVWQQTEANLVNALIKPRQQIIAAFRENAVKSKCPDLHALTNPVTAGEEGMRFYAEIPLRDLTGQQIGVIAASDWTERNLSREQYVAVRVFAGMAEELSTM